MIEFSNNACGVGSNFLRMIDWLWYAKHSKEEVYINWINDGIDVLSRVFSYQNPEKQTNLKCYNHFVGRFQDNLDVKAIAGRRNDISFYDKYDMNLIGVKSGYFYATPEVYFENDFKLLRNIFKDILTQRFVVKSEFENTLFDKKFKTLGIHARIVEHYCSGHHNGPTPITDSYLFFNDCSKFVYEEFVQGGFEKVYLACDVIDFYNSLLKYFKDDQIIKINYERLVENIDWDKGNRKMSEIVHNTFLDIFNLSKCDKIICGVSNLTMTSLFINPNLNFEFFPILRQLHSH